MEKLEHGEVRNTKVERTKDGYRVEYTMYLDRRIKYDFSRTWLIK